MAEDSCVPGPLFVTQGDLVATPAGESASSLTIWNPSDGFGLAPFAGVKSTTGMPKLFSGPAHVQGAWHQMLNGMTL